ncbi:MAG: hypothetical protein GYA31_01005 [Parcubacteria group bacterium]|nr:hypothetical protein [Parcubacteria group bacterium]
MAFSILNILKIVLYFWWLIIVIILGKLFFNYYRNYRKKIEKKKKEVSDWIVLEIKINREILQTPKAMEQVFAGLHSIKKGNIALEIMGLKKEIIFFVRLPKEYRKLFEAQLYAQYPEVDIKEVYDYFSTFPPFLPNKDFDLCGSELILTKPHHYPIRTYPFFEEPKEEKRIDPLASLIEAASQLQASEYLILQIILKPLDSEKEKKWIQEGTKEINKIIGKEEKKIVTWRDWFGAFVSNFITAIYTVPVWPESKSEEKTKQITTSSGDKEKVEQIEAKISKLGFEVSIRFIYIGARSIYDESASLSIPAYFKQFNTENLNSFKLNDSASTEIKTWLFKNRRTFLKKMNFYQLFKEREESQETIILNTEELASIYHFPVLKVKAPALIRALSRKGEAPSNLPI